MNARPWRRRLVVMQLLLELPQHGAHAIGPMFFGLAMFRALLFALLIVAGIGLMAWVATQDPSTWNDIGNDTHF